MKESQDHVHLKDGSIHDKKGGKPNLSNKTKKFLDKQNWPTKVKDK